VTEDNPVNAELLTTLLRKFGHATHVATSGHEALAALERDRFDLVLMDLQMPGLDGIKTTASIRQNERGTGRHTPIIAVTAHALQGTRELCLAAGMDDYLAKPIDRHDLFAAIERAVAGAAPERLVPSPALPVDHILQQVSGDAPAARKLISLFLETTPPLLAEVRAALKAGDSDRLRRATHTLKGSVTQLGDAPSREAALRLEALAKAARLEAAGPILAQLEARLGRLTGELRELLVTLPAA
jgi:CheY-like chemotaxis protein/HPt (histidine-containing phosphotransfer) domain-containing protein